MEQAIGRQLNKTREFLGVEKGKKLSEISEQVASACEISEKQMQDVVSAISEVLIEFQQIGVTPEIRDGNTIEDVLAEAAKVVAEKCVLSAGKIVNVFCHLYVRMGERQKKNIFGDLVSLTATSGSRRSALSLAAKLISQTRPIVLAQKGQNTSQVSANVVSTVAQKGSQLARYAASALPEPANYTTYNASKALAVEALVKGGQAYNASKALAAGAIQRGGTVAKAAQAMLPSTVVRGGSGLYSLAEGAAARGWGAISRVRAAAAGLVGSSGQGGTTITTGSLGGTGSSFAMLSVSRSMIVLNAALLPLSVYDPIKVSAELRDNKKSRAGDFLRKLADDLSRLACD